MWRPVAMGTTAVMRLARSTVLIVGAALLASTARAQDAQAPEALLAQAAQGLAQATSYHLRLTQDGRGVATADVRADGQGRLTITGGRARASIVVTTTTSYVKGNRTYWAGLAEDGDEGLSSKAARKLADRWVKESVAGEGDDEYRLEIDAAFDDVRPAVLAKCLIGTTGTLRREAPTAEGLVVVHDAGDKPGSARRRITVHATAPVLPVRVVQTGRRRTGEARTEACATGLKETTDRRSEIRLSRFGRIGPVTAPRGAVTVSEALGS